MFSSYDHAFQFWMFLAPLLHAKATKQQRIVRPGSTSQESAGVSERPPMLQVLLRRSPHLNFFWGGQGLGELKTTILFFSFCAKIPCFGVFVESLTEWTNVTQSNTRTFLEGQNLKKSKNITNTKNTHKRGRSPGWSPNINPPKKVKKRFFNLKIFKINGYDWPWVKNTRYPKKPIA